MDLVYLGLLVASTLGVGAWIGVLIKGLLEKRKTKGEAVKLEKEADAIDLANDKTKLAQALETKDVIAALLQSDGEKAIQITNLMDQVKDVTGDFKKAVRELDNANAVIKYQREEKEEQLKRDMLLMERLAKSETKEELCQEKIGTLERRIEELERKNETKTEVEFRQ